MGQCVGGGVGRGGKGCPLQLTRGFLGGRDHILPSLSPGTSHKAWPENRMPARASCLPLVHF